MNPCPTCRGGWLCKACQDAGLKRDRKMADTTRRAVAGIRMQEASRLAAELQLESDEAGTAMEKAKRILSGRNPIPKHMIISGA